MAEKKGVKSSKSSKGSDGQKSAGTQGNIHVEGNVVDSNIIIGNNNVIIIDGKQVAFHTGWFFGHRYGDLATFIGRETEIKMLDAWLANHDESLLMLRALGGFGKSALAWTWFNRVDREQWPTAVWWSFYEKESGFESFLSETLRHLCVEVKESTRQQVNDLLEAMHGTNILIVLDGFERLLRQYGRMDAALQSDDEDADIDPSQRDCSSPLTETFLRGLSGAGMKSKVLMTTRLCPRALESADGKLLKGCRDESLSAFSPDDAVMYFHNEGIKATRAEIIAVCAEYGYHPLSLSLLVGLINADHEQRGDIAAVKNLEIFEDVKARRHHVLERAYESLAPERRDLLSKISCFRGSMEYAVLKKVFPSPDLDKALLDLRKRGLLQYAGESQRYDMHPIVRHYAYDRLTDKQDVHSLLQNYFASRFTPFDALPNETREFVKSFIRPDKVERLEDLAGIIELYYQTVRAGRYDEAIRLFHDRIGTQLYHRFGAYQTHIELLSALLTDDGGHLSALKRADVQVWALNALANSYSSSGQPGKAVSLYLQGNRLNEKTGDKINLAIGLANIAYMAQIWLGDLSAAEQNLRGSINLCRETKSEIYEAISHLELGHLLSYRGAWKDAEQELAISTKYCEKTNDVQGICVGEVYSALRFLLIARDNPKSQTENLKLSIESAQHALELAEGGDPNIGGSVLPRDLVHAHWLLGSAYRANNDLTLAEENLSKALNICRHINLVEVEADILLDIARLYYAYGSRYASKSEATQPSADAEKYFKDAQEKASEALMITERSGYVLQGADINLFLAQYTLEQEKDKAKAKQYAEEAKKLATCDGPPYYYKVAYDEAVAMLERLNL